MARWSPDSLNHRPTVISNIAQTSRHKQTEDSYEHMPQECTILWECIFIPRAFLSKSSLIALHYTVCNFTKRWQAVLRCYYVCSGPPYNTKLYYQSLRVTSQLGLPWLGILVVIKNFGRRTAKVIKISLLGKWWRLISKEIPQNWRNLTINSLRKPRQKKSAWQFCGHDDNPKEQKM